MDSERFDGLVRSISGTTSRRGVARALVGAALGGLLTPFGRDEVGAACAGIGRRCGKGRRCCGDAVCRGRTCRCPKDRKKCGNHCIPKDQCCGGCSGCDTCADGRCELGVVPICASCEQPICDEESGEYVCEADAGDDGQECAFQGTLCGICRGGRCENTCKECETCGQDGCIPDIANNGLRCGSGPDTVCCHGACIDTKTDENHCGACGRKCRTGEECVAGACRPKCPDEKEWCYWSCCPAGGCYEGEYCCAGTFSKFCPGNPGTCCRPEHYCKTGPNGNAVCSSNP